MNIQTEIVFSGTDDFNKLLTGAEKLYEAVKTTMGPSGNTIIIDKGYDKFPTITKDGVTVAKSIYLKDKMESIGASLIKEVATRTNEVAGDGTTTGTVFSFNLLKACHKAVKMGSNPIDIKAGIDNALIDAQMELAKITNKIHSYEEAMHVATISANGDKELGKLIADAVDAVGNNGFVTVEPSKNFQTSLQLTNGMLVNGGYITPYFITNSEKSNCVLENPYILIVNQKISGISEILPILEAVSTNKKSLLIICEDLEGDALQALVTNKTKNILKVCAIKAPSYGEHRLELLQDLAFVLGTEVFGGPGGASLRKANIKQLGKVKKATVTKTNTVMVTEATDEEKERLNSKVQELELFLTSSDIEPSNIERIRSRLSKLTGSVAVVRVGGATEAEMGERKDRIEDALNATLAAKREGVVVGGGCALLKVAFQLERHLENYKGNKSDDFFVGYKSFIHACKSPFQVIIGNAGKVPEVRMEEAKTKEFVESNRIGFNAKTGEWGDMISEGILDPALVTNSVISFSAAVIGLAISCRAIILDGNLVE